MSNDVMLRHLLDLCRRNERTGLWQYSAFLSPAEQDDLLRSPEASGYSFLLTGGYEGAERRILAAGSEAESGPPEVPLSVIAVRPKSDKYAEDLTHRDFLGALMALVMPGAGFDGYSLLLPRMLGYFGTHFMVVIMAIAIVSFGLYRPKFKDLLKTCGVITLITFCVFLIDLLLIYTGLYPNANYFYAMRPIGNPLLELFHGWIPLPFLYLIPCLLILVPYMALVTTGFWLVDKKNERSKSHE